MPLTAGTNCCKHTSAAYVVACTQSAGEPTELQQLEAQRQAVLNKGDVEGATKHEMQILATLLNSQFGQAHVDQQQDLVMLQVMSTKLTALLWSCNA